MHKYHIYIQQVAYIFSMVAIIHPSNILVSGQLAAMSSHFHANGINILHPLEKGMIEAVFFTLKLSQIVHI